MIDSDAADVDGLRLGGSDLRVLSSFQANQDAAFEDGEVLTVLPTNRAVDIRREEQIYAIFNKPVDVTTVTPTSFVVETSTGTAIPGARDFPLRIMGVPDPRVARFTPTDPLPATTDIDITLETTIGFGLAGALAGQTLSTFGTVSVEEAVDLRVQNITPGFPDQINLGNFATLMIEVDVPDSAQIGDRVVVRVYGLDPETTEPDDFEFVERSVQLGAAGCSRRSRSTSPALWARSLVPCSRTDR